MKARAPGLTVAALAFLASLAAPAKKPQQTSWGYISNGPVKAFDRLSLGPHLLRSLGRGTLVAVFGEKEKGGKRWAEIMTSKPVTLEETLGWIDSSQLKFYRADRFPTDADLFLGAGAPFTDDIVAASTAVTRLLLQQRSGEPSLVCLFESPGIASLRLQFFTPDSQGYRTGPYLEFPNAEIRSPVSDLETKDAVRDGNECLISHESFSLGMQNQGVRIAVRRLERGAIKTLWTAPLEYTNLSSYDPQPRKLTPPEKNVGAPGTVTKATADFAADGAMPEIIWKAKIEFHILGREQPIDTLTVEKHCKWNGSEFEKIF
jgi:hypothetical protein